MCIRDRYISLIGICHPEEAVALRQVTYRTAKQKGGSDRKAFLYAGVDAQTVLDKIHGAPVVIKEIRKPAVQPAATGNLIALLGGYFDADAYEPMNEAEFEALQDWCWPEEAGAG